MEIRKTLLIREEAGGRPREYIFFKVAYNHFREVSSSQAHEVLDREEPAECECVLCLPDSWTPDNETPLILSFHGAGQIVCEAENQVGGLGYVQHCINAGYAALDVCGSAPHGITMGCPEHLFAAYKAYRYAVKRYHLSRQVLVAGGSMGGHTALNFANTFPSIVTAAGLFFPRLNMDSVCVDGHLCIGTWDKRQSTADKPSTHQRLIDVYRFPKDEWNDDLTAGFNPYRSRSFIGADGRRVVMPPCPIKIWQGISDPTVDPVMVQEYVRSVRRAGCYIELHMLENHGHHFSPVMAQELKLWFDRFI